MRRNDPALTDAARAARRFQLVANAYARGDVGQRALLRDGAALVHALQRMGWPLDMAADSTRCADMVGEPAAPVGGGMA
ncbi:hypothetical protein GTZ99_02335 [Novosphingobium sp. FSY-8]|uniref:Uncharacterized protein n=1 Tax=Novosphingobium ovatum TaxID=1908523 RepID=A0ABW9XA43_9SPHN|nr:hypothetical protein [Novosphingobium ovatum]NBC35391.1 hypothetical protein [Novosphingobium ovatum]